MKIDFSQLSQLETPAGFVDAGWEQLRASDNRRHYRYFKQLTHDGVPLDIVIKNEDNIPSFEFKGKGLIWLFPKAEQYLLQYLSSGRNTEFPKFPADGVLPDFRTEDDYILRHIKREIERGRYEYSEEIQDGTDGIRFIGLYPYGSIDYGFMPLSWEQLQEQLKDIEPFVYIYPERDIPELHNTNLPTEYRDLPEGEHLDSVFDRILTNTIINKTVCGCGATYMEIEDKTRNSIIIEPNIPVILGKMHKHPQLIGIYGEKIDMRDVTQQIQDRISAGREVKIIVTPDSYDKAVKALSAFDINYRRDYFILFDECEKIVSDIDFRKRIDLPIDDFFRCRNKAMVSATPIIINDPRFEQYGFKIIKVRPQYDHKIVLELKPTNNIAHALKRTIDKIPSERNICLFYNSIRGTEDIIAYLKLPVEQVNIYCSSKARKDLRRDGYNVFDSVIDNNGETILNKYNFFTSRFYSAVDIEVECKPVVIMVTNVYKTIKDETPYSLIDPQTEAIQIAGRFRNGIERLIHITNTDNGTAIHTREQLQQYLDEQHNGLLKMTELYNSLGKDAPYGEREIIRQAIARTDYVEEGFINFPSYERNYFRYNNYFLDERLKMLYTYPAPLYKAYDRSGAFTVICDSEYIIYTDEERRQLKDRNGKKANRIKLLYEILKRLGDSENPFDNKFISELKEDYPLYMEAFSTIGYAKVKELEFKDSDIRTAVNAHNFKKAVTSEKVKKDVYKIFKENEIYKTREIIDGLKEIYARHEIELHRQPQGADIKVYFDAEEWRSRNERGWKLKLRL